MKLNKVILICILIFFLSLLGLYFWGNTPNSGEIISTTQTTQLNEDLEIKTNTEEKNSCFSFFHDQNITQIKTEELGSTCIIRAKVEKPIGQLSISVIQNTENENFDLTEQTGVTLRKSLPDIYTQEINIQNTPKFLEKDNNISSIIFTNKTEITGFFTQSNKLLTVSIHDVATINEEIISIFREIIDEITVY